MENFENGNAYVLAINEERKKLIKNGIITDNNAYKSSIHELYKKLLRSGKLEKGIAFELYANIVSDTIRICDFPMGHSLFDIGYFSYIRGDGGIDGSTLDVSRMIQAKHRPNVPIQCGDARDFLYVKVIREKETNKPTDFLYILSDQTKMASGAEALCSREKVDIKKLPYVEEVADHTVVDNMEVEVTNSVPHITSTRHAVSYEDFSDSQKDVYQKGMAFFYNNSSCKWVLQAVGGWGKSSLARALIRSACTGMKVLVLSNSDHLCTQLTSAFHGMTNVTVMTYQKIISMKTKEGVPAFDAIFCDEAHHLDANNKWRAVVTDMIEDDTEDDTDETDDTNTTETITSTLSKAKKVVYMSAMYEGIEPDVSVDYETALKEGRIVDYQFHLVKLRTSTDTNRPSAVAIFLASQSNTANILLGALTIVFWSTTARAKEANEECIKLGLSSASLSRSEPMDVQRRFSGKNLLSELAKLEVIHVCAMLNEGIDVPFASTIVFGDDKSGVKNGYQCILRGSRVCYPKTKFNIVAFCDVGSICVGVEAIKHMAGIDKRMNSYFDSEDGKRKLRKSRRIVVHVEAPPPNTEEALNFDKESEKDACFEIVYSATRNQVRGDGFSEQYLKYQAMTNWILEQKEPVKESHLPITVKYTYLGQENTYTAKPGCFLSNARSLSKGNRSHNKIHDSIMDQLKSWAFFNSGTSSMGSGPQLLRDWIDKHERLPKCNEKESTPESKLALRLRDFTAKGKEIPPELVGCTLFEEKHARKQLAEPQKEKSARLLNELASLGSEPEPINKQLYKKWKNINAGSTSVSKDHPLRNAPWTGGEETWKLLDEKNDADKRKKAEDRKERKRQRIEAKLNTK